LEIVEPETLREGLIASFNDGAELLSLDTYETYELDASDIPPGLSQGERVLFLLRDGRCHVVSP
jgi:translation elongation factor P/translation initiation factor 5A